VWQLKRHASKPRPGREIDPNQTKITLFFTKDPPYKLN
jgi:hypothetical protein